MRPLREVEADGAELLPKFARRTSLRGSQLVERGCGWGESGSDRLSDLLALDDDRVGDRSAVLVELSDRQRERGLAGDDRLALLLVCPDALARPLKGTPRRLGVTGGWSCLWWCCERSAGRAAGRCQLAGPRPGVKRPNRLQTCGFAEPWSRIGGCRLMRGA